MSDELGEPAFVERSVDLMTMPSEDGSTSALLPAGVLPGLLTTVDCPCGCGQSFQVRMRFAPPLVLDVDTAMNTALLEPAPTADPRG